MGINVTNPEENLSRNQIKGTTLTLFQFALLLIISSSIVRLASSLYLPALIKIGHSLDLSESALNSTLTIYFIAFSVSTLFAGPLADRYGRKKLIIVGGVIFVAGSILCGASDSLDFLFAGRILQAAGASCIPVSGRAMIRDMCSDIQVIVVLGWMAAIGGLIPIVAPMLGGIITDTLGWRYNFWFLVVFSLFAGMIILLKLPRSVNFDSTNKINIWNILKTYKGMILAPEFIFVVFPLILAFSIQGAYLGASPFVFMKRFGLSPVQYGFANFAVVLSLLAGRYIALWVMKWFSAYTAYVTGAFLTLCGGILLLVVIHLNLANIDTVLITLSVAVTGFGILLPIGVKSIMTAFRDRAGTVSALYGCLSLGMTAVGCFIVSFIQHKFTISSLSSLGFFTIVAGVLIFLSSIFSKKYLR